MVDRTRACKMTRPRLIATLPVTFFKPGAFSGEESWESKPMTFHYLRTSARWSPSSSSRYGLITLRYGTCRREAARPHFPGHTSNCRVMKQRRKAAAARLWMPGCHDVVSDGTPRRIPNGHPPVVVTVERGALSYGRVKSHTC